MCPFNCVPPPFTFHYWAVLKIGTDKMSPHHLLVDSILVVLSMVYPLSVHNDDNARTWSVKIYRIFHSGPFYRLRNSVSLLLIHSFLAINSSTVWNSKVKQLSLLHTKGSSHAAFTLLYNGLWKVRNFQTSL